MAIPGRGGSMTVNDDNIAEIANWSLDLDADDIDVTSFDSEGWKEFLAGLRGWSGSMEGNFAPGDDGQNALLTAWAEGSSVTIKFFVTDSITFEGDAFVQPSIELPVDDKASFSCDFQGTGKLTVPGGS